MTIGLANIINVSLSSVPTGLPNPNINSIALFTNDVPSFTDEYKIYINSTLVAQDFGTNSVTAKCAESIFAQSPNVLSGDGRLVVIPMNGVNAISGLTTTKDLTPNLGNILAVSDGSIKVNVNGVQLELADIDFTKATNIEGIADILQQKLVNVIIEVVDTNKLKFSSKKVGVSQNITLVSGTTGTDLYGANFFDIANATTISGANASGESISDTITRIGNTVEYYGFTTTLQMEDDIVTSLASTVQAIDKAFFYYASDTNDLEPTAFTETINSASQTKTKILFYSLSRTQALYSCCASLSRLFSANFAGSNTSITLHLKTLANIVPDPVIDDNLITKAKERGVDVYTNLHYISYSVAGDYADTIVHKLWFKLTIQIAGYNFLKTTNTKVPQTPRGMEGLRNSYSAVCQQAINANILAPNNWNSIDTFGDPETFRNNIRDKGYYVYNIPISEQSQNDRDDRKAPLIQIAIKFSGAIHSSTVSIFAEN